MQKSEHDFIKHELTMKLTMWGEYSIEHIYEEVYQNTGFRLIIKGLNPTYRKPKIKV